MLVALAVALGTAAHAGCTQDLLHGAVGAAEIAFSSADSDGFGRAIGEVRAELACAGEPIGPSDAAAIHRAEALAAFLARDEPGVIAHYAAARRDQAGPDHRPGRVEPLEDERRVGGRPVRSGAVDLDPTLGRRRDRPAGRLGDCLLYTSDAADEL